MCWSTPEGILVAAILTPADVQDRTASPKLLRKAKRVAPTITHLGVDKGHTGSTVTHAAAKAGVTVDIVSAPKPVRGRAGGWSNAPTARSTTAGASTDSTKSPSTLTKAFSFSAKPLSYSDDSTDPSCSTRFRACGRHS
jgi:hypothetical protein